MKHLIAFLFAAIQIAFVLGKQVKPETGAFADSLERLVRLSPNDSVKIERLLDLSFYWCDRDTSKAFGYIAQARNVMGTHPSDYHQGLLWHHRANVIYAHDMEKAKSYYLRAARLLTDYSFPRAYVYQSRAWNNYGTLLQAQDSAAKYLDIIVERALPYSRMAGDSSAVSQHLQNIGLILGNLDDFESAAQYYRQAMYTLSKFAQAYENKLTVYVNAAKNEMNLGDINQAKRYLDSAEVQLKAVPH